MKFDIIKNPEVVRSIRKQLAEKYPYTLSSFGKVVGYQMPVFFVDPFPQLTVWIGQSSYPREFRGIDYYVATNGGYLDRIIPASEYYKLAFWTIAEELYCLGLTVDRIQAIADKIDQAYRATRTVNEASGHSSFNASTHVYDLKSELGNFFFVSRSLLDTFATLMHFLRGPKSQRHRSFTDFVEFNLREDAKSDPPIKEYFRTNLDWYYRLKDVRDYITHYKSLDVSFYEQSDNTIHVYLEDRFKLDDLVDDVHSGITKFLQFADEHFTKRLRNDFPNSAD